MSLSSLPRFSFGVGDRFRHADAIVQDTREVGFR